MKKIITGFFMSWGMFFAVPCPVRLWDENAKLVSVVMIPFIGAAIGALWGLAGFLLDLIGAPFFPHCRRNDGHAISPVRLYTP